MKRKSQQRPPTIYQGRMDDFGYVIEKMAHTHSNKDDWKNIVSFILADVFQ